MGIKKFEVSYGVFFVTLIVKIPFGIDSSITH